jgi:hypothetical protein
VTPHWRSARSFARVVEPAHRERPRPRRTGDPGHRRKAARPEPCLSACSRPWRPTSSRPTGGAGPRRRPSPWVAFFAASKALKQIGLRMDLRFVPVIDALDGARGVLSVDRLAVEVDVLPSRIEGLSRR